MQKKYFFFWFLLLSFTVNSQNNFIEINAKLDTVSNKLIIQQKTVFYNKSSKNLNTIFLHNWANSFQKNSPLGQRFKEDYKKDLFFADKKELGFSKIKNLTVNFEQTSFKNYKNTPDIIEVLLNKKLKPKDSLVLQTAYEVKIPNAKFTGYGKHINGYNLRFWYINPAVLSSKWELMSNLNMDDLYSDKTNFYIKIEVPKNLYISSNLYVNFQENKHTTSYFLRGNNETEANLSIEKFKLFTSYRTPHKEVVTDLKSNISYDLTVNYLDRIIRFIEERLASYPNSKLFIDKATQSKNPIYGFNQLPSFLRPYSDGFKWDLTLFKAVANKYLANTLLTNKRTDYWLSDGLQTFLMMEYVEKYYSDTKLLGKVGNIWGIRGYNFSKLMFNDKYPFIYQFSTRNFLDQSLKTPADSLSNFNRKIVNKYKAGLGLRYLKGYIGDSMFNKAVKSFYSKNSSKITQSNQLKKFLERNTSKDIDWFFGDYISTQKKIDYTLKKPKIIGDSIEVTIKNNRNITAPVALYGVNNKKIVFKKWFSGIKSSRKVKIPKGDFDRLSLNYENLYPEYNTLDNWEKLSKSLINKPIQFRLIKDVENPYYHQIYYQPEVRFNLYDGVTFAFKIHNRPIIPRNLEFRITPAYGTRSKSFTGSFGVLYNDYFEDSKLYRVIYGVSGAYFHYAPELSYKSFTPFVSIQFRRNTLRDVGRKALSFRYTTINREPAPGAMQTEGDKYGIFVANYFDSKPNIIEGKLTSFSTEISQKFGKISADFRYRKFTGINRRMDFRFYAGAFLYNNTTSDFFSYGLDRANDYLFQLNYFGRSESTGFFSQQFILAEGGFNSKLSTRFANQYMLAANSNIGIWRWLEVYNNVALLKNRDQNAFFGYESGIRLNFVPNILEFRFPVYSNNGFEITQAAYGRKIRFVLTARFSSIYNFFRRGFL